MFIHDPLLVSYFLLVLFSFDCWDWVFFLLVFLRRLFDQTVSLVRCGGGGRRESPGRRAGKGFFSVAYNVLLFFCIFSGISIKEL